MCASSAIAFISVKVSCCAPTLSPNEKTPPVAQILITSAPYLWTQRTFARASSGLSMTDGPFLS